MGDVISLLQQPKHHEWSTPQPFFDMLNDEFRFTLDAAASSENCKCDQWFGVEDDALSQPWFGSVWCNPPYGTQIGKWIEKAYRQSLFGATVVMLIPSRTETTYWHDYCMNADEIRFVRGRLRFSGHSVNAPFPSCVVVFRNHDKDTPTISSIERLLDDPPQG